MPDLTEDEIIALADQAGFTVGHHPETTLIPDSPPDCVSCADVDCTDEVLMLARLIAARMQPAEQQPVAWLARCPDAPDYVTTHKFQAQCQVDYLRDYGAKLHALYIGPRPSDAPAQPSGIGLIGRLHHAIRNLGLTQSERAAFLADLDELARQHPPAAADSAIPYDCTDEMPSHAELAALVDRLRTAEWPQAYDPKLAADAIKAAWVIAALLDGRRAAADSAQPDESIVVNGVDLAVLKRNIEEHGYRPSSATVLDLIDIARRSPQPERDAEGVTLRQMVADYEEALRDKRRLAREIDVALHGEEGAAKQASLCDLVRTAQKMRERVEVLEIALRDCRFVAEHYRYRQWAQLILRSCGEVGLKGSPPRTAGAALAQGKEPHTMTDTTKLLTITLSTADLDRLRQWFNAVQDLNPRYLEPADFALVAQIHAALAQDKEASNGPR